MINPYACGGIIVKKTKYQYSKIVQLAQYLQISYITLLGNTIGTHPAMTRFSQGVSSKMPKKTNHFCTWNPGVVLNRLAEWYPASQ